MFLRGPFSPETRSQALQAVEQKTEKNELDFGVLEKKEEVLKEVEEKVQRFSTGDREVLLKRLFEHSSEDGLRVAEDLRITSSALRDIVATPKFYIKHENLIKRVLLEIKRNKDKISNQEEFEEFKKRFQDIETGLEKANYNSVLRKKLPSEHDARALYEDIDSAYEPFLKSQAQNLLDISEKKKTNREIYGEKHKDGITMGEEVISQVRDSLIGKYYTGDILKHVFKEIKNSHSEFVESFVKKAYKEYLETAKKNPQDFERFTRHYLREYQNEIAQSFIDEHTSEKDGDVFRLNCVLTREEIEPTLAKVNIELSEVAFKESKKMPLDITLKMEAQMAEKELVKETTGEDEIENGKDLPKFYEFLKSLNYDKSKSNFHTYNLKEATEWILYGNRKALEEKYQEGKEYSKDGVCGDGQERAIAALYGSLMGDTEISKRVFQHYRYGFTDILDVPAYFVNLENPNVLRSFFESEQNEPISYNSSSKILEFLKDSDVAKYIKIPERTRSNADLGALILYFQLAKKYKIVSGISEIADKINEFGLEKYVSLFKIAEGDLSALNEMTLNENWPGSPKDVLQNIIKRDPAILDDLSDVLVREKKLFINPVCVFYRIADSGKLDEEFVQKMIRISGKKEAVIEYAALAGKYLEMKEKKEKKNITEMSKKDFIEFLRKEPLEATKDLFGEQLWDSAAAVLEGKDITNTFQEMKEMSRNGKTGDGMEIAICQLVFIAHRDEDLSKRMFETSIEDADHIYDRRVEDFLSRSDTVVGAILIHDLYPDFFEQERKRLKNVKAATVLAIIANDKEFVQSHIDEFFDDEKRAQKVYAFAKQRNLVSDSIEEDFRNKYGETDWYKFLNGDKDVFLEMVESDRRFNFTVRELLEFYPNLIHSFPKEEVDKLYLHGEFAFQYLALGGKKGYPFIKRFIELNRSKEQKSRARSFAALATLLKEPEIGEQKNQSQELLDILKQIMPFEIEEKEASNEVEKNEKPKKYITQEEIDAYIQKDNEGPIAFLSWDLKKQKVHILNKVEEGLLNEVRDKLPFIVDRDVSFAKEVIRTIENTNKKKLEEEGADAIHEILKALIPHDKEYVATTVEIMQRSEPVWPKEIFENKMFELQALLGNVEPAETRIEVLIRKEGINSKKALYLLKAVAKNDPVFVRKYLDWFKDDWRDKKGKDDEYGDHLSFIVASAALGDDLTVDQFIHLNNFDDEMSTAEYALIEPEIAHEAIKKMSELLKDRPHAWWLKIFSEKIATHLFNQQIKQEDVSLEKINGKLIHFGGSGEFEPQELLKKINSYFETYHPDESKKSTADKIKEGLRSSVKFAHLIAQTTVQSPALFKETLASKKERKRMDRKLARALFPEIAKKERTWRNFGGYGGFEFESDSNKFNEPDPEDYLDMQSISVMMGGDPEHAPRTPVLKFREPMYDLVVTGIYGRCSGSSWDSSYQFSASESISDAKREITVTAPRVKNSAKLPKPVNSAIIRERVKGIKRKGEMTLPVDILPTGEAFVPDTQGAHELTYSVSVDEVSPRMHELSEYEYEKFKREFIRGAGNEMTQEFAELSDDMNVFVHSIEKLAPKEKIKAIEHFVRANGSYDMKNSEVIPIKRNVSFEERIEIMEARARELGQKGGKEEGKKFAGVCADFAVLTAALLRKAGFLSGVLAGFLPDGNKATIANAHGTAFVVWPDERGRTLIFPVDGTPDGIAGISGLSIDQKEKVREQKIEELKSEATEKLAEIEKALQEMDVEKIRTMTNGELEGTLNTVLKYDVSIKNWRVLETVLHAYWYSPLHKLDIGKLHDKIEFASFLEKEILREREKGEVGSVENAGTRLFKSTESFLDKFVRSGHVHDMGEAVRKLNAIVDLLGNNLTESERRSITAIVTYLRAKQMTRKS